MKTDNDKSINTSSWQSIVALVVAIGASVCCVAPLVLLSLGIGGAWVSTLTAMEPLRPFFIFLSLLFIGLGYRQIYIMPSRCAEKASCAIPKITYRQRLIFWLSSAFILTQVVGWSIDDHMRTSLCVNALQMAFWRRKPEPGLLHHSDRGSQYASKEYRTHLSMMKMQQSMSRKGDCWDNAPTERFFRSLKYEQLNYEKFRTKESAKLSIIDYLAFYNGKRIHSKLSYQSPIQYEREFYKQSA